MALIKAQQNQSPTAFVNKIQDPATRQAILEIFRMLGEQTSTNTGIGRVIKPLTTHLNAGGNQVKRAMDPTEPQDLVTLSFLQSYVANFASALGSAGLAGGGTGTDPDVPTVPAPTNQLGIVEAARVALGINAGSTPFELFKFAQTVVWNISLLGPDPVAGLVGMAQQDIGDGIYLCTDIGPRPVACFRIMYDNGANIKILTGTYTSQWTQEGDIAVANWTAPTDPAVACP